MSVIQPNGGGAVTATSTNNKTGRFKGASDASVDSGLLNGISFPRQSDILGNVLSDNGYMDKALSTGTFAYLAKNKYVVRRVSKTLAGVSTNVLINGAANKVKHSIHKIESFTTRRVATAIASGLYDIYDGTFSVAPTVATDNFGNDDAARPSYSVPGELTYKTQAPAPVNDEYHPKTN